MAKIIFSFFAFFISFNLTSLAQVSITPSSDVSLGDFVAGTSCATEAPFNEILFTISSPKDTIYTIKLDNLGSQSNIDKAGLSVNWYISGNLVNGNPQIGLTEFVSGGTYQFKRIMYVKAIVTNAQIASNAITGNRIFPQKLTVEVIN